MVTLSDQSGIAGNRAYPAAADGPTNPGNESAIGNAANSNAFLLLLVAQIRNQNPLNPADGVEFLAQLAQFSQLEQMIGIRAEIEALRRDLQTASSASSPNQP